MDIKREGVAEAKRRKRIIYGILGAVLLGLITLGLYRLEPAAPSVDRATVWIEAVKRGEMLRQVRGPGTLVPEEVRFVTVSTEGRVDRIHVLPGARVEADTIILVLSNSELEQRAQDSLLQLRAAQAEYADLKVRLRSSLLNEQAVFARVQSDLRQATLQAEADARLHGEGLIPELKYQLSKLTAEELVNRVEIERERLAISKESVDAQLLSQKARLEQTEALHELHKRQVEALKVKPGIEGVLQEVPVEVGHSVPAGTVLAKVAQPEKLKAELRIAETQAKDILIDQKAKIDTRNGVIDGKVSRIDPAVQEGTVTVDVELTGELPRGARPDLSVDGTIEIEHLEDVLYVGRPAYGQAESRVGLFRLLEDGRTAVRVPVELGKSSVNTIEVRDGLAEGDQVILSDTSAYEDYDRIRLN